MSKLLKLGASGVDVTRLQEALIAKGFNVGKVDGSFGNGTEAAVRGYQHSEGLTIDGVVGAVTLQKLGIAESTDKRPDNRNVFTIDAVATMFPFTPKANIAANLPCVLAGLAKFDLVDAKMVLMALSTIRAETESFLPVLEGISKYNTSPNGRPYDLYDNRKDIGNRGVGEGARFAGRGYIQLTGRDNYTRYGKIIGVDLVSNPEKACDKDTAGLLLATFLKSNEPKIKTALVEGDLRYARRLVNGGSHGIDRFTDAYNRGLMFIK